MYIVRMRGIHDLECISPSRETANTALRSQNKLNNSDILGGKCNSFVTTELSNDIGKGKCSALTMPKPESQHVPDSHPLLTKPQLLRKKDSEIQRYKELVLKNSLDWVNAISGEQIALVREGELRRKLRELRARNEVELRIEKLRNKERFLTETGRLRAQRNEARMIVENKDILIRRLRMRVKQLEQLEKQREKEISHMKEELETKK